MSETHRKPNHLINETSPYLLQHAYNPVEWYPWGDKALQLAQKQDKPIIVSIGYAACHWCHVMERESFENKQVAEVMNENFICIKVDREERPDVDQVYMDAIHAMGVRGGWPLNVILTPQAKPFYGGTYFPPQNWVKLLKNIAAAYKSNRQELEESAEEFMDHLNTSELLKLGLKQENEQITEEDFSVIFNNISKTFDKELGGRDGAPKFPMPANYLYLLRTYFHFKNDAAKEHLELTLREMAWGGIYDQVGGGFARYSVDERWLVPHFEKMLYDNGQLVSLYAQAYQLTQDELYKQVVYETIEWLSREMTHPEGAFYASLDADSEGEEGKFYVFNKKELEYLFIEEEPLVSAYYNATEAGNWESGHNILHRRQTDEAFAKEHNLGEQELKQKIAQWKHTLLHHRNLRPHPGLDDKILTSWNAMMLCGLCDAYRAFAEPRFLKFAEENARFLIKNLKNGLKLHHNFKNGNATIAGFLEDYAWLIKALLSLYQVTFEEEWLKPARELTDYVNQNFWDENEQLYFFTDQNASGLIARKKEVTDNVVPSSNSVMAANLHWLGLLLDKPSYTERSDKMLAQVKELVLKQPSFMGNWASLYYNKLVPAAEVVIVGNEADEFRKEMQKHFLPQTLFAGTTSTSTMPLLEDREAINGETTIYVCRNKTCQMPVHTVEEALKQVFDL